MKKRTQGEGKIITQFKKFAKTKKYNNFVKVIRKEAMIPEGGFSYDSASDAINLYTTPSITPVPEEPKEGYISHFVERSAPIILEHFGLKNRYLQAIVKYHIILNTFLFDELNHLQKHENTCSLEEAEYELENYMLPDSRDEFGGFSLSAHNDYVFNEIMKYPISIRIDPSTSQRDVVDFIESNWSDIKGLKEKYSKADRYSFKNSRTTSNKKIEERDDFIWDHKDLPSKEILAILYREFGSKGIYNMDEGAIRKVISAQKKIRQ